MITFFQTVLNFINDGIKFIQFITGFLLMVPGHATNLQGVAIVTYFSPFILVALFATIVKLVIKGGK